MEEPISTTERIFVVRKNAIKMIMKRQEMCCGDYGNRGFVLKITDDMNNYESFVKKVDLRFLFYLIVW